MERRKSILLDPNGPLVEQKKLTVEMIHWTPPDIGVHEIERLFRQYGTGSVKIEHIDWLLVGSCTVGQTHGLPIKKINPSDFLHHLDTAKHLVVSGDPDSLLHSIELFKNQYVPHAEIPFGVHHKKSVCWLPGRNFFRTI